MEKIVIAGSASLQEQINYWKDYWENAGLEVIDYPSPISPETFLDDYPTVHTQFFQAITETDVLFVMNEDKRGIKGYIGPETFAEMCFGVAQNLVYHKSIEVILLQIPSDGVPACEEVKLWLKLGWIKLH